MCRLIFFFNVPPTTEIYTLSLHDALPISQDWSNVYPLVAPPRADAGYSLTDILKKRHMAALDMVRTGERFYTRSEEHTSELQSRRDLVCRLLLEKKKNKILYYTYRYPLVL